MTVLELNTSEPESCKLFILKLTSDKMMMAGLVAAAVFIFPPSSSGGTSDIRDRKREFL